MEYENVKILDAILSVFLVTPGAPTRKTSQQLRQHSDFVKPIRTWMLQQSQLPNPIPGTTIRKPANW